PSLAVRPAPGPSRTATLTMHPASPPAPIARRTAPTDSLFRTEAPRRPRPEAAAPPHRPARARPDSGPRFAEHSNQLRNLSIRAGANYDTALREKAAVSTVRRALPGATPLMHHRRFHGSEVTGVRTAHQEHRPLRHRLAHWPERGRLRLHRARPAQSRR